MTLITRSCIVILFGILSHKFGLSSSKNLPEVMYLNDYKDFFCSITAAEQLKLPEKFQSVYNEVKTMCADPASTVNEMRQILREKLTDDDRTEIQLYFQGRDDFCDDVLSITRFRIPSDNSVVEVDTIPDFIQLKIICRNSTSTLNDMVPFVLKIKKEYGI